MIKKSTIWKNEEKVCQVEEQQVKDPVMGIWACWIMKEKASVAAAEEMRGWVQDEVSMLGRGPIIESLIGQKARMDTPLLVNGKYLRDFK